MDRPKFEKTTRIDDLRIPTKWLHKMGKDHRQYIRDAIAERIAREGNEYGEYISKKSH